MFDRSDLEEYLPLSRLRMGEEMDRRGAVGRICVSQARGRFGEELVVLTASVHGDKRDFQEPRIYLEKDTSEFYAAWCGCDYFQDYSDPYEMYDLCEHCAALALSYFRQESRIRREYPSVWGPMKPKTDAALMELLEKHGQKELMRLTGDPSLGKVKLEPTLHLEGGDTTVSFRVGMDRMYVVKDVREFAQRIRNMENHSYGKSLTFVHQPEAFDGQSRLLAEFLVRNIPAGNYYYSSALREMPLYDMSFDEFLEICGSSGILVIRDAKDKTPKLMTMTDAPLRQTLTLVGTEDGAELQFHLPRRAQSRRYNYFFKDTKIYRQPRAEQNAEELSSFLYDNRGTEAFIAREDLPLFVRNLLPLFEQQYVVRTKDLDLTRYQPAEAQFQVYLDLPQENMITCDLVAVYADDQVYHVFQGIPQKGTRNVPQEMAMRRLITDYCNAMDQERYLAVAADDEDLMYRLLTEGIQRFREAAEVYLSDRLRRIAEVRRPNVAVGVSLSGDLLNLTISSEGMSLSELASILSRYDRRKKFIRLKNGEFFSMEDENLHTLARVKDGLALTDRQMAKGEITVPKFRAMYLDEQLKESGEISVRKSRDFRALIRQMHSVEDSDCEVPESLAGILREYQKNGYRWMETLYENGFGGILADDMGLGKTLQVITFLTAHYGEGEDRLRTLIVCPASLVYNWESECRRFSPDLPVIALAGPAAQRHLTLNALPPRVVLITSYDLLKRDLEAYEGIHFDYQVIDEAQYIKNTGTKAAQAVKAIDSGFRMALTGTPVENRLSELWSIFDYLMPGYLYSYQKFRTEIETPVVQEGNQDALQRVQKMIAPFVLRRLKKDVLKDLPDKIEKDMVARMEGEQKELYEAHVQRLKILLDKQTPEEFDRSKIQILAELTKLRQLCCDPSLLYEGYAGGSAKLDLCLELVQNAIEGGHKLLIFSQFTTMLDIIGGALAKKEIPYYMLTGATGKTERMRLVNSFNKEEDATPVFLISLKAGGTGLNLTAADIVIHYDPWWNTAAQNQATDRTHRIGQKNVVNVYKLIAQDTIEDNIVRLQERKQELADQVLGGSDVAAPTFNKEELLELLGSAE